MARVFHIILVFFSTILPIKSHSFQGKVAHNHSLYLVIKTSETILTMTYIYIHVLL